jgi:hypothetical protein
MTVTELMKACPTLILQLGTGLCGGILSMGSMEWVTRGKEGVTENRVTQVSQVSPGG